MHCVKNPFTFQRWKYKKARNRIKQSYSQGAKGINTDLSFSEGRSKTENCGAETHIQLPRRHRVLTGELVQLLIWISVTELLLKERGWDSVPWFLRSQSFQVRTSNAERAPPSLVTDWVLLSVHVSTRRGSILETPGHSSKHPKLFHKQQNKRNLSSGMSGSQVFTTFFNCYT